MKKIYFLLIVACCVACSRIAPKYLVTNEKVGVITKETKISELDSLLAQDSLVKPLPLSEFGYTQPVFSVYSKGKAKDLLLEITPSPTEDYIQSIRILGKDFKTPQGINPQSTFADIKKVYKDFDFFQALSSVVVIPKESNLYFTFSKEDLLSSNTGVYTIDDIPDTAKIKDFSINWVR